MRIIHQRNMHDTACTIPIWLQPVCDQFSNVTHVSSRDYVVKQYRNDGVASQSTQPVSLLFFVPTLTIDIDERPISLHAGSLLVFE